MRKAKRGLKRSEARRSGHRTYIHKQRPEDRLTSGAAFPREIRVRTTHFASESESRAITSASQSPPRGAIRGAGGEGGGGGGWDAGVLGAGGGWEGLGDGGGASWLTTGLMSSSVSWFPTGSWGTKMLQAMTDAARAPAECGVAASHARVLREWRQRYFIGRGSSSGIGPCCCSLLLGRCPIQPTGCHKRRLWPQPPGHFRWSASSCGLD